MRLSFYNSIAIAALAARLGNAILLSSEDDILP